MSIPADPQTEYESLNLRREDGVAVVELNRPDSLNAISVTMGRELLSLLTDVAADASVRSVVLTGAGRAFSSGADLKSGGMPVLESGRPDLGWTLREVYNPLVLLVREMPQPVVAAVNGVAAGIGWGTSMEIPFAPALWRRYSASP